MQNYHDNRVFQPLAHNKLTAMEPNAISFGEDIWNYDPIRVVLSGNGLKDADVKVQTLANLVRQKVAVRLDLSNNSLTRLNQTVFEPFLAANRLSSVVLNHNAIKCGDCGNRWLFAGKLGVVPSQAEIEMCSDDPKRSLSQFSESDFKKC